MRLNALLLLPLTEILSEGLERHIHQHSELAVATLQHTQHTML